MKRDYKVCPKCDYQREALDDECVPKTECPKCGVIYSKYVDLPKFADSTNRPFNSSLTGLKTNGKLTLQEHFSKHSGKVVGLLAICFMVISGYTIYELIDTHQNIAELQQIKKLAEQGDASAQSKLGVMYRKGEGIICDYAEALKWLRKAAQQGDVQAQVNLSGMYHEGEGVPPNYAEALKWLRKAADQGNAAAQYHLAGIWQGRRGHA